MHWLLRSFIVLTFKNFIFNYSLWLTLTSSFLLVIFNDGVVVLFLQLFRLFFGESLGIHALDEIVSSNIVVTWTVKACLDINQIIFLNHEPTVYVDPASEATHVKVASPQWVDVLEQAFSI